MLIPAKIKIQKKNKVKEKLKKLKNLKEITATQII